MLNIALINKLPVKKKRKKKMSSSKECNINFGTSSSDNSLPGKTAKKSQMPHSGSEKVGAVFTNRVLLLGEENLCR